jgi:signal transduction histidine kinase
MLPLTVSGQAFDAESYYRKAEQARSQNPDSARFYTDAIFEAYQSNSPSSAELQLILNAANLRRYMNDFSKAREVLNSYRSVAEQPGFEKQLAFLFQTLGVIDSQQGRYQSASEHLLKGIQLYDVTGDSLNKAVILKELGIVHERLKLNDLALTYGKDALRVIKSIGDSSLIAGFLADVGTMHQNMGKLDEALPYHLESLKISQLIGESTSVPYNYHNIGDIYLQKGLLDSAEVYTKMALELFEGYDLRFVALYSMMNLGLINLERGNYTIAEEFLQKSYLRAKEFDGLYEQAMLLEKLSTLYERTGRFEVALKYQKDSYTIRDSLSNAERERTILETAESYKNDQATQEIERLRDREVLSRQLITTQRVFLIVVSIVLISFIIALVLIIRANRDVKHLNRELLSANARLTNISDEKANLIYVMAHDLRSPLAQITSLCDLLRETIHMNSEQLDYVALIESASQNCTALISQMVESNSSQTGIKHAKDIEVVDLHDVIDSSLSLYEIHARNKNVKIIFDDDDSRPRIKTDPLALRRVIDNLVSNAIKYTYHETEVRVTLTSEADQVKIFIRDNGPGFSADDKLLLFRKFTTLSARPTGNESSTGLGLAIVHDLLKQINGSIYLIEDEKPGAHFCVELPNT